MQFFRGVLSPVLFVRRVAGSVAPDTGFNRRGVASLGGIWTSSQPRYDMHKVEEGSESFFAGGRGTRVDVDSARAKKRRTPHKRWRAEGVRKHCHPPARLRYR